MSRSSGVTTFKKGGSFPFYSRRLRMGGYSFGAPEIKRVGMRQRGVPQFEIKHPKGRAMSHFAIAEGI